jgi:hypothetical protein
MVRKRLLLVLMIGIGILTCAGTYASDAIKCTISADFYTKYIWRGQNVSDRAVFEPTIALKKYGFTGFVWGNMDLTGQTEHCREFIEMDYVLDYTAPVPDMNVLSFSVGTIYYDFPNTAYKPTTEIYGGLSLAVPLSPFIKIYRDVDEAKSTYIQAGVGHTVDKLAIISDDCYCSLRLGCSLAYGNSQYNKFYFASAGGKLNDLNISLAIPFCYESWTITPSVYYSMMVDSDIRSATARSDNLWGGVSISRSF